MFLEFDTMAELNDAIADDAVEEDKDDDVSTIISIVYCYIIIHGCLL